MDETQWFIGRIVEEILRQAPDRWSRMEFKFVAAGNMLRYELELDTDVIPNIDPPEVVKELRHSMFAAGHGIWYTMRLTIESNGSVSASFDSESRPPGGLVGLALEDDLRLYPRNSIPNWIYEDLEKSRKLTRSGDSSVPLFPVVWEGNSRTSDSATSAVRDSIDRVAIGKEAATFVPVEAGMLYLKLAHVYSGPTGPVQSFIEVDAEGYENRRVNVFPDGLVENASLYEEGEFTTLSDARYFIPGQNVDTRYAAVEITPQEFQAEWLVAEA